MLSGNETGLVEIGDRLGDILRSADPADGMLIAILRAVVRVRAGTQTVQDLRRVLRRLNYACE